MAILKHIASKNADYGETQRYLMFQYDEYTGKPILDENGRLIPREEYYLDGINCDPFHFDTECKELNARYHKNQTYDEIKSHHYILSFDPKDAEENGLTGERAQQLGLEYAQKNFPGHQALICTHMDGNNISEGITPRKTAFQTQKDFLRTAIEDAAASTCSQEEFQKLLMEKYHITLKISRGRFSYLHPDRNKPITGRNLGTHYEEKYLLPLFKENAEIPAFIFIKSDLRLVVDLQQCVKAQQSHAYAQKVKLSNLQQMAKTVAYVQEHGYDTQDSLQTAFSEAQSQTVDMRKALRSTEQKIKEINEQIHYTGQYLANKSLYSQFLKSKNKKSFRQEHQTEITLYETARKILKEQSNGGKLPSINP